MTAQVIQFPRKPSLFDKTLARIGEPPRSSGPDPDASERGRTAETIAFSIRDTPEWPRGWADQELERIAQSMCKRMQDRGASLHIEAARRQALKAFHEMKAQLKASGR